MSAENPYASPSVKSSLVVEPSDRSRLRDIAKAQRQVNFAVLMYLCLIPVNIALTIIGRSAPWSGTVFGAIGLCVVAFGAISVYKLAALFRGKIIAVIYVVGLLVPLLGLILLVTLSQKATKLLQQNGISVGLLGANPATI